MIRYNYVWILALLALAVFGVGGCGGSGTPAAQANTRTGTATLTIEWPTRTTKLIPAASNCILVKLTDSSNNLVAAKEADRPYTTSSPNPTSVLTFTGLPAKTLTVTASSYPQTGGKGTAQASGTAPLTITAGQTATLTVTMNSTITSMTVSPPSSTVDSGVTQAMTVTAYDASGSVVLLTASNISWSSNTPSVATVDPVTGLVTAVANGTATITATDSESQKSGSTTVTVKTIAPGTLLATIQTNVGGHFIAVNPKTHKVYVDGWGGPNNSTVCIIDGTSNTVITTLTGPQQFITNPHTIAVNPVTNQVYVADPAWLLNIDGATNAISVAYTGTSGGLYMGVNTQTNTVYLLGNGLTVLNGSMQLVGAPVQLSAGQVTVSPVVVDSISNMIYVPGAMIAGSFTINVVDGSTNTSLSPPISVGNSVIADLDVNPTTHKLYVADQIHSVYVIDEVSKTVLKTITLTYSADRVAVNPVTNKIYVTDHSSSNGNSEMTVIDGSTDTVLATVPLQNAGGAVAVDTATNIVYVNGGNIIAPATGAVTAYKGY